MQIGQHASWIEQFGPVELLQMEDKEPVAEFGESGSIGHDAAVDDQRVTLVVVDGAVTHQPDVVHLPPARLHLHPFFISNIYSINKKKN